MWKFQPHLKKVPRLFPSNPPLKIEVLSSAPFLNIWLLEAQPSLPRAEKGGVEGSHYDKSWLAKKTYLEESETKVKI